MHMTRMDTIDVEIQLPQRMIKPHGQRACLHTNLGVAATFGFEKGSDHFRSRIDRAMTNRLPIVVDYTDCRFSLCNIKSNVRIHGLPHRGDRST
jgi:hypothetical protein